MIAPVVPVLVNNPVELFVTSPVVPLLVNVPVLVTAPLVPALVYVPALVTSNVVVPAGLVAVVPAALLTATGPVGVGSGVGEGVTTSSMAA